MKVGDIRRWKPDATRPALCNIEKEFRIVSLNGFVVDYKYLNDGKGAFEYGVQSFSAKVVEEQSIESGITAFNKLLDTYYDTKDNTTD